MADTTDTTPATTQSPQSRAQTTRKTAATSRSTAAKKGAATRARNQAKRSTAAKKAAAETRRQVARTPVERYADLAERAVTIQVGAALVARDNVVELANRYSSLDKVERELRAQRKRFEKDLRAFERRGTTARTALERELRQRTERVERDLRGVRSDAGSRAGLLSAQVENLVQTGVTVGTQVAAKVTERVSRVA